MSRNQTTRRRFLGIAVSGVSAAGFSSAGIACGGTQKKGTAWEPKISENLYRLDDSWMRWMAQLGHKHVVLQDDGQGLDIEDKGYWSAENIRVAQKKCLDFGMELSSILLPIRWYRNACAGKPERDREIENMTRSIRAAGEAGVPVLEWRPTWLDFYWDERVGYSTVPGRGGSGYRHFSHEAVKKLPSFDEFEPVSLEEMWDRMLYLGKPIIDAAEKAGVLLSCHPNDPPVKDMRGMPRILTSAADFDRFFRELPSPANGVTFCQGTFTEMGEPIVETIKKFGSRIHHIHLRGVRGTVPEYTEVFIDEGDISMFEAMKAYKEIGYEHTIVSDHTPDVEGGPMVGRAFSHGYIRAMVQAVNAVI